MYLQLLSTMIPLQWLYAVLSTWRLHRVNFLLLLCTLVDALFMLPSAAPWFSCCPRNSGPLQPLTTHVLDFSLPSRSSILNLVYLCYFRLPICDFHPYSSPLSLLSNATGLTQFGFFKGELYPISHTALIMDCFSRAHLYGMPRVIISSFASKIDRVKDTDFTLSFTFYIIPIRYSKRELWKFS